MGFTTFFGDRFDRVLDTLPKLFGPLDPKVIKAFKEQVEWVELRGGQTLFHQFEAGDSMYIVAGGRLQAVVESDDGTLHIVGEVARGEPVGELALLTGEPRAATVCAVRDSLLMRLQRSVFDRLVHEHPDVLLCISRTIIERMRASGGAPGPTFRTSRTLLGPDFLCGCDAGLFPFLDDGVEAASVVDPLPVGGGFLLGEAHRLGLAVHLPGPLVVGAVQRRGYGLTLAALPAAWHPALDHRAAQNDPDLFEAAA